MLVHGLGGTGASIWKHQIADLASELMEAKWSRGGFIPLNLPFTPYGRMVRTAERLERRLLDWIASKRGQRDDREYLTGIHVHDDAAGTQCTEFLFRGEQFLAHHVLDPDVERQFQRFAGAAQPLLEREPHSGDAVLVDPDAADQLFSELESHFDAPVLVLINNAGISRDDLTPSLDDEQWNAVIDTDLTAAFRLTRRALKVGPVGTRTRRWTRFVNDSHTKALPWYASPSASPR